MRKKNLGSYQLHKWSLPKDYSDFGFVSGNILILFSIYIFLPSLLSTPSVGTWLAVQHTRVSPGLGCNEPAETRVAFIMELDTRFMITADWRISLKLHFMKNHLFQCVKITTHFLLFDCCGSYWHLFFCWPALLVKERVFILNKNHSIPSSKFVNLRWSCDNSRRWIS